MRLLIILFLILASAGVALANDARAKVVRGLEPLSIRGVNYYPCETPWDAMWTKTPPEVWNRGMALASSLGINTIRTFVQFGTQSEQAGLMQSDGALAPAYQSKIESLLAAAWTHRIRVIFCFEFDSHWLAQTNIAARWQRALSDLVGAHRNDGRVLLWDLMNEPDDAAKWNDGTRAYLKAAIPFVKQLDTNHLVTIGLAWKSDFLRETGLPEVMQYHEYAPKAQLFTVGVPRVIQSIANQRRMGGTRPVLIGEFGLCTSRDPQFGVEASVREKINEAPGTEAEQAKLYKIILAAAEKERIAGVIPWCLYDYPIKNPNESRFGLVRADGSLKPAASVLKEVYQRWSSVASISLGEACDDWKSPQKPDETKN